MKEATVEHLGALVDEIGRDLAAYRGPSATKAILQSELESYHEDVTDLLTSSRTDPNKDISELLREANSTLTQFKTEVKLRAAVADLTIAGEQLGDHDSIRVRGLKSEIEHSRTLVNKTLENPNFSQHFAQTIERDIETLQKEIKRVSEAQNNVTTAKQGINPRVSRRSIAEMPKAAMNRLSTTLSPKNINDVITKLIKSTPTLPQVMRSTVAWMNNIKLPSTKGVMNSITTFVKDTASQLPSPKGIIGTISNFVKDTAGQLPSAKGIMTAITTMAKEAAKRVPTLNTLTELFKAKPEEKKSSHDVIIQRLVNEEAKTKEVPTTNPNVKVTVDATKVNQLFDLLTAEANKPTSPKKSEQTFPKAESNQITQRKAGKENISAQQNMQESKQSDSTKIPLQQTSSNRPVWTKPPEKAPEKKAGAQQEDNVGFKPKSH
jgi:hypothetical protein